MGLKNIPGKSIFSEVLPVALFAGVTAYGIHRSLFYGWIEWFFDSTYGKTLRISKPLISTSTIKTLLWRWNQSNEKEVYCNQINEHLNAWADFIQLQFTSAVCIFLGMFVGAIIGPGKHPHFGLLILLMLVFFIAAVVSNWRFHSVLDYVKTKKVNSCQQQP
jgi:hypothetical protein